MNNINNKMENLRPFFIGFKYLEGSVLVECILRDGWNVLKQKNININNVDESDKNYYVIHADEKTVTLDNMLDYLSRVIKYNIDKENKKQLFKEKLGELKEIFLNNKIELLETLEFTFNRKQKTEDLYEEEDDYDIGNLDENTLDVENKNNDIKTNKVEEISNKPKEIERQPKFDLTDSKEGIGEGLQEFKEPEIKCPKNGNCTKEDICPLCIDEKT